MSFLDFVDLVKHYIEHGAHNSTKGKASATRLASSWMTMNFTFVEVSSQILSVCAHLSLASRKALAKGLYLIFRAVILCLQR